jgi:RHS repeat-associated protein
VVAVISGDGQTVSDRYGYDPFGNTVYRTGSVTNPWGYAGGYTDPTGLIQFGARYYDPSTARWTQVDPAAADSNLYGYAQDDPVNLTDPTGEWACCYVARYWSWWGVTIDVGFVLSHHDIELVTILYGVALGLAGLFAAMQPELAIPIAILVWYITVYWAYISILDWWSGDVGVAGLFIEQRGTQWWDRYYRNYSVLFWEA